MEIKNVNDNFNIGKVPYKETIGTDIPVNKLPENTKTTDSKIKNLIKDILDIQKRNDLAPSERLALAKAKIAEFPPDIQKEIFEKLKSAFEKISHKKAPLNKAPLSQPPQVQAAAPKQVVPAQAQAAQKALRAFDIEKNLTKSVDEVCQDFAALAAMPGADQMAVARKLVGTMMRINTDAAQRQKSGISGEELKVAFNKACSKLANPGGVNKMKECMQQILAGLTSKSTETLHMNGPAGSITIKMNVEVAEIGRACYSAGNEAMGAALDFNLRPIATFIKNFLK